MHILSFSITPVESTDDDDQPYLDAWVTPLISGTTLEPGCFDSASVIALGAGNFHLDIFTCSCGVPECAGFWSPVIIKTAEGVVSWHLPEVPYRAKLPEALKTEGSLTLSFEQAQYENALAQLEQDLLAMQTTTNLPVTLAPSGGFPDLEQSLAETLANVRLGLAQAQEEDQRNRALFGRLFDAQVELSTPTGTYLMFAMSAINDAAAYGMTHPTADPITPLTELEARDNLVTALLDQVRDDDEALFDLIRHLPTEARTSRVWCSVGSRLTLEETLATATMRLILKPED